MPTTTLITADEFDSLSFDQPVELFAGELVYTTNPGACHGAVCVNRSLALGVWAKTNQLFSVLSNGTGIQTSTDPDSVRGPDVYVVKKEALGPQGLPSGRLKVAPTLAVEVRSPSNTWRKLLSKGIEFLAIGVKEVWIVDPTSRHVHVYQENSEPTILKCTKLSPARICLNLPIRFRSSF